MRWRVLIGPSVVLATVGAVALINWQGFAVATPAPIFLWTIVFAAYFGGIASGFFGTAIAVAYAAFYLSEPGAFLQFQSDKLIRLLIFAAVAPAIALTVGLLHARERQSLRREQVARTRVADVSRETMRLRAALNQVDYGVVLLDRELRARFINRAFRRLWKLSDEKAESRPAFVGLMYHARDNQAYAMPADAVDAYVAERVALVRHGDMAPLDLRLANGGVVRFRCTALPDGGHLLTYTNVSDFVHQSEQGDADVLARRTA